MSDPLGIQIVAAPSLLEHVREGLAQQGAGGAPEDWTVDPVTAVLQGSEFPIEPRRTHEPTIQIAYHLGTLPQPLFRRWQAGESSHEFRAPWIDWRTCWGA